MLKAIHKIKQSVFLSLFLVTVCLSNVTQAANLFVSNDLGTDDTAPGRGQTVINPYKSIGFALAQATSGDVLIVAAGLYKESITFDKSVTLQGPNSNISPNDGSLRVFEAIIQPPMGMVGLNTNGFNITVRGFRLDANGAKVLVGNGGSLTMNRTIVTGVGNAGEPLAQCDGLQNLQLIDNRFADIGTANGSFALDVSLVANGLIESNTFRNTDAGGLRVGNSLQLTIRRNTFNDILGFGLRVEDIIGANNSLNTLVEENYFEKNNKFSDPLQGAVVVSAATATQSIKIVRNVIRNSFNGIYTDADGGTTSTKVSANYNIFEGNSNAGVFHQSPGVLDIAGNYWGSANGPQHNTNPAGLGNQKVLPAAGTQARYSPWMATNADAAPALVGYQYPTPTTYVVKGAVPAIGLGLIQKAADLAFDDDIIEFRDANYNVNGENALITKDLTFSASTLVTLRDLNLSGASDLATVTLNGDFDARFVNMTAGNGGQILTGNFRLRLTNAGTLTEAVGGKYVIGRTVARRALTTAANDFGNIGFSFFLGTTNNGTVTITRDAGPGTAYTLNGNPGINRVWQVSGATNLGNGRNARLSWLSDDDNGVNLANLRAYYSSDNGNTWTPIGAVTDASNGGDPRTIIVNINANGLYTVGNYLCTITANAGADQTVCVGSSITLGATPSAIDPTGAVTYTWTPTAGLNSASAENPIFSPTTDGIVNFTLTVKDAAACEATDVVSVTVLPRPTAHAGPDRAACPDFSVQLNGSGTGGTGALTYTWAPNDGSLSALNIPSPTVNLIASGTFTYTLRVTDENNCQHTDQVNVVMLDLVANAGADQAFCLGGSRSLQATATGGDGNYSYAWDIAPGLSPLNVANPTFNPIIPAIYNLNVTVTDALGCQANDVVQIVVHSLPQVSAGADKEVCTNAQVVLDGNVTGGSGNYTIEWFPNQRLNSANIAKPTFSAPVPGAYLYLLTAIDGNGCTANDNMYVYVTEPPIANAGTDIAGCAGVALQLNGSATGGSAPYNFDWTPNNSTIIDANTANPLVVISTNGSFPYTLTVTDANGCTSTDNVIVNIKNVNVQAPTTVSVCSNKAFNIPVTASGGTPAYNYQWSPNFGIVSGETTANPVFSINTPGTYFYTVTVSDAQDCFGQATIQVTVGLPVIANAGPDRETCIGTPVTLFGNATGGSGNLTYQWFPEQRLNNPFIPNPVFTHTVPGSYLYLLTVTDAGGCQSFDNVIVYVAPGMAVNAGADINNCLGGTFTLQGSVSGGLPPYTIKWGPNNNTIINPNSLITPATIDAIGVFEYTLTVTDANGCVMSDNVLVTNSIGVFANAGPDREFCPSSPGQLFASINSGSGPFAINWSPNDGSLSSATVLQPLVTQTTPGTYTYTLTVTDVNGCASTDQVNVVIKPSIFANAGPAQLVCPQDTFTLSGSVTGIPNGVYAYSWAPNNGTVLNPTSATPKVVINTPGTYTYTLTVFEQSTSCVSNSQVMVTVKNGPVANAGPDRQTCVDQPVQFLGGASGGSGNFTYSWFPVDRLSNASVARPNFKHSIPGTYLYLLTVTDGSGCTARDNMQVIVRPTPTVSAGPALVLCNGAPGLLQGGASGGVNPYTYSWTPDNGTVAEPNQAITGVQISTPGTYVYSLKATDAAGCTAEASTSVRVKSAPLANAGPNKSFCPGGSAVLQGSVSNAEESFGVSWIPAFGLSNPSILTPTVSLNQPGTYTYTLNVSDATGCVTSSTVEVVVIQPVVALAGPDLNTCLGTTINLQGGATGGLPGTYTYQWFPTTNLSDPASPTPAFSRDVAGTYTYTLTVKDLSGCAVSSDVMFVTVVPYGAPRSVATTTVADCNSNQPLGSITVTASTDAGDPYQIFTYSLNGGSFQASNFFGGLSGGTYQVTIRNQLGCSTTRPVTVAGAQAPEILAINSITSNSARVIWTQSDAVVQSYTLQYRVVGAPTWTEINGLFSTVQFINDLQNNTSYEVRVRGVCTFGNTTAWSPIKAFQTLLSTTNACRTPGNVYVSSANATTATVSWTAIQGNPTCYTITWGPANVLQSFWEKATVAHPAAEYVITGLEPGVQYVVRVRTNCTFCDPNAGQLSDFSPRIPFTTGTNRNTIVLNGTQDLAQAAPVAVSIYPNPTRGPLTMRLTTEEAQTYTVLVRDLTGRLIKSQTLNAVAGLNDESLDLSGQAAGVYVVEVRSENFTETLKVVLQ